ncbi:PqqD family peptide modification chaperone [Halomonas marinisediminis]|uniref:PqqD family peptide modification chaperone n=1 Tax=Halomonas marinisediminis TaxID=2546095 RepID=A0ABY2DA43_9GAMM|nr:PqqD family peptide modification chaperone [Halomonas marinisediminis]
MRDGAFDISLPGLGRCLRVEESPDVIEALRQALAHWPPSIRQARGLAPAIRLRRRPGGYWQRSPRLPRGLELPTSTAAVCSLIADLGGDYLDREASLLGLHCASVEVDGRLVLFPEGHRAGKSTLAVAFSAAGYRLFGDDVLGLTREGEGVALGMAPRLRLPLPESFSPPLVEYAEAHAGPQDSRYRFVLPPGNGLAEHGERCAVGALVLLERDDRLTSPDIIRLQPGEGLLQLLMQNFAYHARPEALMAHLLPLMERVPCLLLRYAEPLTAARHLGATLEGGMQGNQGCGVGSREGFRPDRRGAPAINDPVPAQRRWVTCREVRTYPLGRELFLIQSGSGEIHRLNETGTMIWRLLGQESLGGRELGELLAEYYGQPAEPVIEDVCRWLAGLADVGLVTSGE